MSVFTDTVHLIAQAMRKPFSPNPTAVEKDWQETRNRFTDEEYNEVVKALTILIGALDDRREEFLGVILEAIGANNKHNGQFFTPSCIARVMAKMTAIEKSEMKGILTLTDPACGASVLLIEQGEELLRKGIRQEDIYIVAGDIDSRACDISYIELSLLGYAACVERKDAIYNKDIQPPRYTVNYFSFAMPMRRLARRHNDEPIRTTFGDASRPAQFND